MNRYNERVVGFGNPFYVKLFISALVQHQARLEKISGNTLQITNKFQLLGYSLYF
jgi:hypothetical protein